MIYQTRADIDSMAPSDRLVALRMIRGACTSRIDTATRPDGYSYRLQPGDNGFVAPVFEDVVSDAPARQYGYSLDELDAEIAGLSQ